MMITNYSTPSVRVIRIEGENLCTVASPYAKRGKPGFDAEIDDLGEEF